MPFEHECQSKQFKNLFCTCCGSSHASLVIVLIISRTNAWHLLIVLHCPVLCYNIILKLSSVFYCEDISMARDFPKQVDGTFKCWAKTACGCFIPTFTDLVSKSKFSSVRQH